MIPFRFAACLARRQRPSARSGAQILDLVPEFPDKEFSRRLSILAM